MEVASDKATVKAPDISKKGALQNHWWQFLAAFSRISSLASHFRASVRTALVLSLSGDFPALAPLVGSQPETEQALSLVWAFNKSATPSLYTGI